MVTPVGFSENQTFICFIQRNSIFFLYLENIKSELNCQALPLSILAAFSRKTEAIATAHLDTVIWIGFLKMKLKNYDESSAEFDGITGKTT